MIDGLFVSEYFNVFVNDVVMFDEIGGLNHFAKSVWIDAVIAFLNIETEKTDWRRSFVLPSLYIGFVFLKYLVVIEYGITQLFS